MTEHARSITGYGLDYEAKISAKRARALCGMYPMPQMGYETCVAFLDTGLMKHKLYVQNVSGTYALACTTAKRSEWPELFGVAA
ncbi:hypothetical protein KMB83_gp06 [Ralstonia phage Anchaing]|uniref:Uncharacterized protein n=1 Tax=Ralstonia phage Anchaing TaxID=2759719 RepID=A0A7G5B8A3_9CAUD|nr:hypothetical protein KMB83_gp06 [Ralstonia phage Anchaing]QMV32526.1 hypothetical protein A1_00006 [Ralstonia phage Anchaing]